MSEDRDDTTTSKHDQASNVYSATSSRRTKRGLIHLANVMKSKLSGTGYNHKSFWNYGNWCGSGGSGGCVNSLDACCYTHDKCYRTWKTRNNDCDDDFADCLVNNIGSYDSNYWYNPWTHWRRKKFTTSGSCYHAWSF
jgi:hypothetical protein